MYYCIGIWKSCIWKALHSQNSHYKSSLLVCHTVTLNTDHLFLETSVHPSSSVAVFSAFVSDISLLFSLVLCRNINNYYCHSVVCFEYKFYNNYDYTSASIAVGGCAGAWSTDGSSLLAFHSCHRSTSRLEICKIVNNPESEVVI